MTDAEQTYIVNILVEVLNGDPSKPMLICSKSVEVVNH